MEIPYEGEDNSSEHSVRVDENGNEIMVINMSPEKPHKFKSTHCTSDSIDQPEEMI